MSRYKIYMIPTDSEVYDNKMQMYWGFGLWDDGEKQPFNSFEEARNYLENSATTADDIDKERVRSVFEQDIPVQCLMRDIVCVREDCSYFNLDILDGMVSARGKNVQLLTIYHLAVNHLLNKAVV